LQKVVGRAWRARRDLRDPERVGAFVHRIVVNEAPHTRRGAPLVTVLVEEAPSGSGIPGSDRSTWSPPATGCLRSVVALHAVLGYPVDEVAEIVHAPRETVRARLGLAIARLRREVRA
jgi:DNA-directed RNA polymerase specialized sigma24 family protein